MALFDELPEADPAPVRAIRAALAMQKALGEWNKKLGRDMAIRIGINVGRVVRGDIGSRHVRRDYTVIGDAVNRAQRFESKAPRGDVLVGERTYQAARDRFGSSRRTPAFELWAWPEPVNAYVVLGGQEMIGCPC